MLPDILASFPVHGVMSTPLAVFLQLDTIGIVLLVLLGRVITALALGASERDQRTHTKLLLLNIHIQLELHRKVKQKEWSLQERRLHP
jgi:hypothetical protein